MTDIDALRKVAEEAKAGPWYATDAGSVMSAATKTPVETGPFGRYRANAAYIAAANPTAVLDLLDRLAAAERERDALAKAMWGCRTWLGFDPDGDDRFHNPDLLAVAAQHVREAEESRNDHEAVQEELAAAEAAVARCRALESILTSLVEMYRHTS